MPSLFSRDHDALALRRHSGDLSQFGGVTPLELSDGRARGTRALLFRTGRLTFLVLADRGLDIAWCDFEGHPLGWMSPTGVVAPWYYEPEGLGWLRSFYGGLLETGGLTAAGAPSETPERKDGLHGRIGNLPCERLTYGTDWEDGDLLIWAEGVFRETIVFGEQLTLTRRIECWLGGDSICITDCVTNEGFQPTPFMLLYHVNAGYPVLDADSRLYLNPTSTTPVTDIAAKGQADWDKGAPPQAGWFEHVYYHQVRPRADGYATAALVNPSVAGGLALAVHYRVAELPWLWEWRMLGEGTYVMGLEPANSGPFGRAQELEAGRVRILQPGEQVEHAVELEGVRGEADIAHLIKLARGEAS